MSKFSGTACIAERLKSLSKITPHEYLAWAKDDLKTNDTKSLVGAVKNIKGAIDSQLNVLLEKFGLLDLAKKHPYWSFPYKINIIAKTDITSPKILNKINKIRIDIEHNHKKPYSKTEIEESLEIAEMFLEICKGYHSRIRVFIDYGNKICVFLDETTNTIKIYDKTDEMLDFGGIEQFDDYSKSNKPKEEIRLNDLDKWLKTCGKYLK